MFRTVRQNLRRHGVREAAYTLVLKLLARSIGLTILKGFHVARPLEEFLACPARYAGGFLGAGELRKYAQQSASQISMQFLDAAIARGDQCYAFRHGEELAAYGWYAVGPTPIGLPDLVLTFAPGYVYMYKGYTAARHRGQRLHAIGKTRALAHYRAKGCKGLLSYLEADNFNSLKSGLRMGAEHFGSIYIVRILGRNYAFSSPGCRRFAFRLERAGRRAGAVAISASRRPGPS